MLGASILRLCSEPVTERRVNMRHRTTVRYHWWSMGLALAVGLWAAAGWAQPVRGGGRWSHGTPFPALINAAGVSEEQKTQIKAIVEAHRPELRKLYSQLRTANQTLNDRLMRGEDTTSSVQDINEIRGRLLATTVKMRQDILA